MFSVSALAPHASKLKFLLNENSTVILTGVGVVGTAATAVLTGRASFKAADLIEDQKAQIAAEKNLQENRTEEYELQTRDDSILSKTEKFKLVWPHYIPPIAVGVTTIAAIIVAHRIDAKKIAALAIATGVSERVLQEYKDKVVEKFTDRQATAIDDEIAQDRVNNNPPSGQVIIAGSGDVLCFDDLTGRYFNSTIETIKRAENKVNYTIIQDDYCSLSTFFEEIGLRPTTYSDMVGWNVNHRMEVKFSTTMSEDSRPCLVLGFTHMPVIDYDKPWVIG
jgi:hypothetical protein